MRFNRASHLVLPIENDPGHCLPKLVDSREARSHVYRILIVGGGVYLKSIMILFVP